jgi:type III pantothenate kinase
MMLLLDLGNSRLKWACCTEPGAVWTASGSLPWSAQLASTLRRTWAAYAAPATVLAASVVDDRRETQVDAVVRACFRQAVRWVRTPASACGVRNAYADPGALGVDRFLNMVAAHAAGQAPCVLASAGTALALDALTAGGQHLGGLIAPGAQLMRDSLLAATARIRPGPSGDIVDAARNTADAVNSGCWQALAALVERFALRMREPLGGAPRLLLTGGDARQLLPLLGMPAQLAEDGVLRGLLHWAVSEQDGLAQRAATGPEGRGG